MEYLKATFYQDSKEKEQSEVKIQHVPIVSRETAESLPSRILQGAGYNQEELYVQKRNAMFSRLRDWNGLDWGFTSLSNILREPYE